MGVEIAKKLAEFTVKTKFEKIPTKTIDFIKGLTLKTVAGMLVGSSMPVGKKVIQSMLKRGNLPEVKLDTVRHWLQVAAEQSEKVDARLIKELKVSQVELDTLWTFVKKKSLRHRAMVWRAKHGLGLPLPRNIG